MGAIDEVVHALPRRLDDLPAGLEHRRVFIETYRRTTEAVGAAVADAFFEDPGWVTRWDVEFADFFLAAHDADLSGGDVPRPWRLAFTADPSLPVLTHLLLGMNAHINYDLPPAMLSVIDTATSPIRCCWTVGAATTSGSTGSSHRGLPRRTSRSAVVAARSLLKPLNRLGEFELLSAAKIADLLAPGPVLLRLAAIGFGVTLPPP